MSKDIQVLEPLTSRLRLTLAMLFMPEDKQVTQLLKSTTPGYQIFLILINTQLHLICYIKDFIVPEGLGFHIIIDSFDSTYGSK